MRIRNWTLVGMQFLAIFASAKEKNLDKKNSLPSPRVPWSSKIEFLWWTAFQDASEFVLGRAYLPPSQRNLIGQGFGQYESASFRWEPGLRISGGYTFARDFWEVAADYTYFHSKGSQSVYKPNSDYLLFGTFADVSGQGLQSAHSHINLNYNLAEIWLGRSFKPTRQIAMDFATGFAGAWINENWAIKYSGLQTTNVKNKWSYHAGGMTTKIRSRWNTGNRIELFNEIQGGLFLGSYLNHNKIFFSPPNDPYVAQDLYNPLRNTTLHVYPVVPMLRGVLGIQWSHIFNCATLFLGTDVEATTWFDLHATFKDTLLSGSHLNDKRDSKEISNVSLYGISIYTGLGF